MQKHAKIAICGLVLASLVIAGCRVRSASEEKNPTPRGQVLVSSNQTFEAPTQEINESLTPETPTETLTETPSATPTETVDVFGVGSPTSTALVAIPATSTPTPFIFVSDTPQPPVIPVVNTPTLFIPPTNTSTATATSTFTSTPSATASSTPTATASPTSTPSLTPSLSPTFTATLTQTPSSNFTLTFTLFPPPTITPQGVSEVGIGGGNSSVTQGQTPTPVLITQVAQDGPNPQQATATAAIATFQAAQTQTAAAQQGIILPTNTLLPDGSGGGLVSTPAPTQAFPDCPHYVQPDTTLGSIARTYNLTVTELAAYNNITNPDFIKAGDTIIIPGCGRRPTATPTLNLTPGQGGAAQASNPLDNSLGPIRYVVQPGDNLYRLSVRFGVTMSEILNANPRITDINVLSVGWELIIPIRSRPLTTPTPTLPVTS